MERIDKDVLQQELADKIAQLHTVTNALPAVVIIHCIKSLRVEYMSARGLEHLGCSLEQLKAMGTAYFTRFFNPEDTKEYVPKVFQALENDYTDEVISFFQQVRISEQHA